MSDDVMDDSFEFEDDDDLEGFSFDDSETSDSNRSPVSTAITSTATGALKSVGPGAAKGIKMGVEKAFPEAGEAIEDAISTAGGVKSMVEDFSKEIEPTIKTLKSVGNQLLPKADKFLPAGISQKLKAALEPTGETKTETVEQARTNKIGASMNEVFGQAQVSKTQLEGQKAAQDEKRVNRLVDTQLNILQHKSEQEALNHIFSATNKTAGFLEHTFTAYLKKSLELKYRHFYVAKDILGVTKLNLEKMSAVLEAIRHNTSLPDVVKKRKSEFLMEEIKQQTMGDIATKIRQVPQTFLKNVKTKVLDKGKAALGNVADMASSITDAMEMADSAGEMGMDKSAIYGDLAGGAAGGALGGFLGKKVIANLSKEQKEKLKEFSVNVSNYKPKLAKKFNTFINENEGEGGVKGILASLLEDMEISKSTTFKNGLEDEGTLDATFDKLTRNSIITVIPGYLAKILKETSEINKGTPQDELTYSAKTLSFVKRKNFEKDLQNKVFSSYKSTIDSAFSDISDDFKENTKEKYDPENFDSDLKKFIVSVAENKFDPKFSYLHKLLEEDENPSESSDSWVTDVLDGLDDPDGFAKAFDYYLYQGGEKPNVDRKRVLNKAIEEIFLNSDSFGEEIRKAAVDLGQGQFMDGAGLKKGKIDLDYVKDIANTEKTNKELFGESDDLSGLEEVDTEFSREKKDRVKKTKERGSRSTNIGGAFISNEKTDKGIIASIEKGLKSFKFPEEIKKSINSIPQKITEIYNFLFEKETNPENLEIKNSILSVPEHLKKLYDLTLDVATNPEDLKPLPVEIKDKKDDYTPMGGEGSNELRDLQMELIEENVDSIATNIEKLSFSFDEKIEKLTSNISGLKESISEKLDKVSHIFSDLPNMSFGTEKLEEKIDELTKSIKDLPQRFEEALGKKLKLLNENTSLIAEFFKKLFGGAWKGVKGGFDFMKKSTIGAFNGVKNFLPGFFGGAGSALGGAADMAGSAAKFGLGMGSLAFKGAKKGADKLFNFIAGSDDMEKYRDQLVKLAAEGDENALKLLQKIEKGDKKGLLKRAGGGIFNLGKKGIEGASSILNKIVGFDLKMIGSVFGSLWNGIKNIGKGFTDLFFNRDKVTKKALQAVVGDKLEAIQIASEETRDYSKALEKKLENDSPLISHLKDIKSSLKNIDENTKKSVMKGDIDNDGIREGSWRDQLKDKKEKKEEKALERVPQLAMAASSGKPGLLGRMGNFFQNRGGGVASGIRNKVGGLKEKIPSLPKKTGFFSKLAGSTVGKLGGIAGATALGHAATGGIAALGSGIAGAAGSAGGAIASGLAAIGPVGWIALGAVAVGAAGYGIYKLMQPDGGESFEVFETDRIRNYGGIDGQEGTLIDLEEEVIDILNGEREPLNDDELLELTEDLGLIDLGWFSKEEKDQKDRVVYVNTWLKTRFVPLVVLLKTILNGQNHKYSDLDDLEAVEIDNLKEAYDKKAGPIVKKAEFLFPNLEAYESFKKKRESNKDQQKRGEIPKPPDPKKENKVVDRGVTNSKSKYEDDSTTELVKDIDRFREGSQQGQKKKKFVLEKTSAEESKEEEKKKEKDEQQKEVEGTTFGDIEENVKDWIKSCEGLSLFNYKDSRGFDTIGYGHLNTEGYAKLSQKDVDTLFDYDYAKHLRDLYTLPEAKVLNGPRKAAVLNMIYNMGLGGYLKFKNTREHLLNGEYDKAAQGVLNSKYARQVGQRAKDVATLIESGDEFDIPMNSIAEVAANRKVTPATKDGSYKIGLGNEVVKRTRSINERIAEIKEGHMPGKSGGPGYEGVLGKKSSFNETQIAEIKENAKKFSDEQKKKEETKMAEARKSHSSGFESALSGKAHIPEYVQKEKEAKEKATLYARSHAPAYERTISDVHHVDSNTPSYESAMSNQINIPEYAKKENRNKHMPAYETALKESKEKAPIKNGIPAYELALKKNKEKNIVVAEKEIEKKKEKNVSVVQAEIEKTEEKGGTILVAENKPKEVKKQFEAKPVTEVPAIEKTAEINSKKRNEKLDKLADKVDKLADNVHKGLGDGKVFHEMNENIKKNNDKPINVKVENKNEITVPEKSQTEVAVKNTPVEPKVKEHKNVVNVHKA